jgi:hypothetical protein
MSARTSLEDVRTRRSDEPTSGWLERGDELAAGQSIEREAT